MNSNSPEDRMLDELLREQAKGPDEAFLKQIEDAIDSPVQKPVRRQFYGSLAAAAAVVVVAGSLFWWSQNERDLKAAAKAEREQVAKVAEAGTAAKKLGQDIRDQEEKVEERRKTLTTNVRTKGINYKGQDSFYGQSGVGEDRGATSVGEQVAKNDSRENAIKRGLSAQDYVDAKREFEADQQLLLDLKLKQAELGSGAGRGSGAGVGTDSRNQLAGNNTQLSRQPRARVVPPDAPGSVTRTEALPGVRGMITDRAPAAELITGDRYGTFIDQPWKSPVGEPLSTFSIDVDAASYGNVRRMIREGREIPKDAVRIEECINAFSYSYQAPKGEAPFAVSAALAVCPWEPAHQLVRVAIKGREMETNKRPASNLVFLIDVSGSMQSPDKLPLLKQSMATLVEQLDDRDRVAIVVYAGTEGVALPSTRLDAEGRATVLKALGKLEAGGSTNGGAGIKRAYELAMTEKIEGGVNRVILATDGDFNVGVTGQSSLVELVKDRAKGGVYLTVLGFGSGNLNDAMMDAITRDGNGNYFYIDSEREGRKVFLTNLSGTLVAIAKDVKIQVEFNPAKVGSYRLIGYSNRVLRNEDFSNDKVDAGDIGAGHTVTAFYELTPPGTGGLKYAPPPTAATDEWLTVKLRHKHPQGDESRLIEFPLTGTAAPLDRTDADFQFATAAALFGMKLRGMEEVKDFSWEKVAELAKPGLANDATEDRAEFVELVGKLRGENRIEPVKAEGVDGRSRSVFNRSPDGSTLDRMIFSPHGVHAMTAIYRMDPNGNPLRCDILDSLNRQLFRVSYGYEKSTGHLVEEQMYDSRVKRIDPDSGQEMPVQTVTYGYDASGKRGEPVVVNLTPDHEFERISGLRSAALEADLFAEAGKPGRAGYPEPRPRVVPPPAPAVPAEHVR